MKNYLEYFIEIIKGLFNKDIHFDWRQFSQLKRLPFISHYTYASFKEIDFAFLKNEVEPENYILEVLNRAEGCHFIIFQTDENNFIQFWTKENSLEFDFPLNKYNEKQKFENKIIKVAKKLNINNSKIVDLGKYKTISIDFKNDLDLASNFSNQIFLKVFKDELTLVRAFSG